MKMNDDRPLRGRVADVFYRRLADRYTALASTTHAPAKIMAAEMAAPVSTVRRWILTARRRGHLPAASGRRAGTDPIAEVAQELGVTAEQLRAAILRHTRAGRLPAVRPRFQAERPNDEEGEGNDG